MAPTVAPTTTMTVIGIAIYNGYLNRDDGDRERPFTAADQAGCVDALGRNLELECHSRWLTTR